MDFSAPSFSLGFDWDDDDEPPSGSDRREQPRYEAPDPPSFSLGIDDDDDDFVEEPRVPAGGGRRQMEHARVASAPDPPSFSLGFDDEGGDGGDKLVADPRREQARPPVAPGAPCSTGAAGGVAREDGFVLARGKRPIRVERRTLDPDPLPPPPPKTNRFAAPDPPSFSLGFDDEDGDGGGILAADQRREQARPPVVSGAPSSTGAAGGVDREDGFALARGKQPVRVERRTLDLNPLPPPKINRFAAPDPPSFSLVSDDEDGYCDSLAAGQRHGQARLQEAPGAPSSIGTVPLPPPAETNRFKRLQKGPAPAHPAPTPQVPHCQAPDAPSSSLARGQHLEQPRPQAAPRAPSSLSIEDDDDYFLADDQLQEPTLPEVTKFKRLWKGPLLPHLAPSPQHPLKVPTPSTVKASPVMSENAAREAVGTGSLEDEIEDWTTDEDRPVLDVPASVGSCNTSSNSKFSLLNRGVVMTQSASRSTSQFTRTPNIRVSPMRKIYLIDSDTDVDDDHNQNKAKTPHQNRKPQESSTVLKSGAMMNDNWATTPVFDEVCNEYFKSPRHAQFSQQKEGNTHYKDSQPKNSGPFQQQTPSIGAELDDGPPAMHYLFHPDPRVGDLFRNRLQHFVPIGVGSTRGNEQNRAGLRSGRRQFSSSAAANDDWVTPRRISVPTDASKRRVHASGSHSGSGHWFTNDNGRKVYVSKYGQELTGRDAYRQYQRESGRGRYRKKGSSGTKRGAGKVKTETAAKRGTGRAKRKR